MRQTRSVMLLIGVGIFCGLPLISWSVAGNIEAFFSHPIRLLYIVAAVFSQVAAVLLVPQIGQNRPRGKVSAQQRFSLVLVQVFSLCVLLIGPLSDGFSVLRLGMSDSFRAVGLIMFTSGFAFMHWAQFYLGKQFSVELIVQHNHVLIDTGPYRLVRHPRYLGIIVFAFGLALVFDSGVSAICATALTVTLFWRIKAEERLLHGEFKRDWENYKRKSKLLVPYLF